MRNLITGILALIIAMGALYFGYNAGIRYAIESAEISASGNIITIELDGDVYEHVAE